MINRSVKYYLCIILVLVSYRTISQVKHIGIPNTLNFHPSEINIGTQTWMIDFSKEGMAYFANNDGVVEFDGKRWSKYPLPGNIIVRCVMASSDGRIYAGGFNQIGYFDPDKQGQLKFKSLVDLIPTADNQFGEVWKIYELPYGIVFQSYEQLMIYKDGAFDIIKAPGFFHFSFKVHSELYINDQEEGLFRLAHDRIVKLPGTDLLKGQLIWAILPLGEHMLIATSDNGLYEYNGIDIKEWKAQEPDIFRNNQVYCGIAISESVYAFGTIQDGIIICDSSGQIIQHINIEKGLQNNTVLSLRLDQYRNLWLGLDNGIDYMEINSPLTYFTHFNGLSAGYAAVLHEDMLYLGTNRGVFYQEWSQFQDQEQSFTLIEGTQGQVWDLKVVDGTLFCGHNSGIFKIAGTEAEKVSDVQGGWTFIQPENRDDILICGTYTSFVKFVKKDGSWSNGTEIAGFKESSRFLANAGDNRIWMTHGYIGVFRIHFNAAYDSVVKVELYNSNHGFKSDVNINVYEIFGKAVFTTEDGFYKYDVRSNSFVPDDEMYNTFNSNDIIEIHEDKRGNVWYFTNNDAGVYRIQEDGSYFNLDVPFAELSGKFINYFQFVYPVDENNVFFGIQDGFAHYAPSFPKNYKLPLTSYIRTLELSTLDSVVYIRGYDTNEVVVSVPFKYNQLKFEFSANDFENYKNLQFSTFLESLDSEWSAWDPQTNREFTNLRHGMHTFKVKARNIFQSESNISEVTFEILRPWYLKWWAYVIYALAWISLIFAMAWYVKLRMEKSKRIEEERQKQLFKEREEKLQTEALEAEKEVIKLRNEKLHAEMKIKDKELANSTMEMIQKNKSLISINKELRKLIRETQDNTSKDRLNLLIRKINRQINAENQWEVFEKHFESVHEDFLNDLKLKFPDLTPRELKLCAYLRLNISSKEIATLMNISTRGVEISRYRLRKKLKLDHKTNLTAFIMSI